MRNQKALVQGKTGKNRPLVCSRDAFVLRQKNIKAKVNKNVLEDIMNLTKILAVAALAIAPVAAQAQNLTARDASSIQNFFLDEGSDVELLEDNVGDPQLNVIHYGSEFTIFFYGCHDNTNCDSIQFYSGYATDGGVRLKTVNTFNAEKRWVRAYVGDSGSTKLEMDLYMGDGGINADDFAETVGLWSRLMGDFEEVIGYN
ncbi:YbjN domain-containing protein [Pseudophaeobacter sp.]|uniref:YbjN domain-containing protein n=1 Tax=Pseudophaeobacter sp. TaxID=1971739 RepID=UPI003296FDEA